MVTLKNIAAVVCIVFAGFILTSASTSPRKLIENRSYNNGWEADMAALDQLSVALQAEPDSTGYIILYGSKRGYRNDVGKRMQCMKTYMLQRRGIPPGSLKVINGGYREHVTIELWVAPKGSLAPVASPTVRSKNVRSKPRGTSYRCNL